MKKDEFFGEVETYRGNLTILVPLEVAEPKPSVVTLAAVSQGCADAGVCYVPHEQKARLQLATAGNTATGAPPEPFAAPERAQAGADGARIAGVLAGGLWFKVASFLGLGLLLAFKPSVRAPKSAALQVQATPGGTGSASLSGIGRERG